jgi:GntR family transcriptional regulator
MPDPLWRQIAEDLRQKIESGELGSGDEPMPSELELREMYRASRNTVRDAVKWLVFRGLVVTRPGQGTFVTKKIDPFIVTLSGDRTTGLDGETAIHALHEVTSGQEPRVSAPRVEILQAGDVIAAELKLNAAASLVSRHQKRYINGMPWSLQTTYYPMYLVEQGAAFLIRAENIDQGALSYIEETLHIKQAGWRDRLTVRAPDSSEADFFNLPEDGRIAVFEIIRTGYGDHGEPFLVTITTCPADRNQFIVNTGKVPTDPVGSAS